MRRRTEGGGLAIAGVRGHSRRLFATAIAITIGVAFVVSSMLLLNGASAGLKESWAEGADRHDLVVTAGMSSIDPALIDTLRDRADVEQVHGSAIEWSRDNDGRSAVLILPSPFDEITLVEGRMPAAADDVVVTTLYARSAGVGVGDRVEVMAQPDPGPDGAAAERGEEDEPAEPVLAEFSVVGVAELSGSPMYVGADAVLLSEEGARRYLAPYAFRDLRVDLSAGADRDEVTAAILAATRTQEGASGEGEEDAVIVRTGADEAQHRAMTMMRDVDYLRMVLLGFGAIGLMTTVLVIANTFRIVLAQRVQELALLRCVGATRGQVRRAVLTEAGLLGAAASALGVLVGTGLTAATIALLPPVDLFGGGDLQFTLSVPALFGPWLVGVLITLAAAWFPTRQASQIQPIHALHPQPPADLGRRAGRLRLVAALGLIGVGGAALAGGALTRSVMLGIAGGMLSFVGVLVAGVLLVPLMIRALGAPARAAGVPGDIAVRSAVSNPGRAAATSAALIIGVTLITMTSVGAATTERTLASDIDSRFTLDLIATAYVPDGGAPIGRPMVEEVRSVNGVAQVLPMEGTAIQVVEEDARGAVDTDSAVISAYSFYPNELAPLVHDPEVVAQLQPGTLGAGSEWLRAYGLAPGNTVDIVGPDGRVEVDVVRIDGMVDWSPLIAPDVLAAIDSSPEIAALAVRLDDGLAGSALGTAISEVRSALAQDDALYVSGGAVERAELTGAVAALVLIVTGLLGVAVLIALVGIANTLSLSVLERSRENALLRALGLTRGQLRAMLAGEGVLLALAGTVIGVVVGAAYGWLGVQSLLPEGSSAQLDLPWMALAGIVVVAVAAGVLASVLPARRAARTAPAVGLAAW